MLRLKLLSGQRLWVTSDTHYSHTNMCRGVSKWDGARGTRDFNTLEEMNQAIVDSINSVVRPDDILLHLGDWSFGGIEQIWEFRKRILCKNIFLFLGNHDDHIAEDRVLPNCWSDENDVIHDGPNPRKYRDQRDEMFDCTAQQLFKTIRTLCEVKVTIPADLITGEKEIKFNFIACHYPIASWQSMSRGVMHIHGHVHLPPEKKISEGRAMDVGVDGNNLSPYLIQEVKRTLRDRPIKTLSLVTDHHETENR